MKIIDKYANNQYQHFDHNHRRLHIISWQMLIVWPFFFYKDCSILFNIAHEHWDFDQSNVASAKNPSQHINSAYPVCHPSTRVHVRLLGPCFKTGQVELCCHHTIHAILQTSTFNCTNAVFHVPAIALGHNTDMDWQNGEHRAHRAHILRSQLQRRVKQVLETQQPHKAELVSLTSSSATSDNVASLFKVMFHLSLMVLICCWSQTCIKFQMKCTTYFAHQDQEAWLLECALCIEVHKWYKGFPPSPMLYFKSMLLYLH